MVQVYKNSLLDKWVGKLVVVKMLSAPQYDVELARATLANPEIFKTENMRSRTIVLELESYDQIGVTLLMRASAPSSPIFVPWGAVIEIAPLNPDAELEIRGGSGEPTPPPGKLGQQ